MVYVGRVVVAALAAVVLVGCAWGQPPAERQALVEPYTISGSSGADEVGQLMLTNQGLWAYVEGRSSVGQPALERGELVGFLPEKPAEQPHLYSVVIARSWGAVLQRLDTWPVAPKTKQGALIGIQNDRLMRRWGLCRGRGAVVDNPCIANSKASTSWEIFGVDAPGRLRVPQDIDAGLGQPIQTDGLLQNDRAVVDHAAVDQGWVAVPVHDDSPPPPHARVAIQPACPTVDLSSTIQPLEVFRHSFEAPVGAIDTEAAAIELGADVLVSCSEDGPKVAVPMLYRPLLSIPESSVSGTPYGAMRPLPVASGQPDALRAVILLGAALGTGATTAADFYLQAAIRAAPDASSSKMLALDLMQVRAASGHPEAGLSAGRRAANGAWHVENKPSFVLGRGWVYTALGKASAHVDASKRLSKLAGSPENLRTRIWMAWNGLRQGVYDANSQKTRAGLSYFEDEDLPSWSTAAHILAAPGEVGTKGADSLSGRLAKAWAPAEHTCPDGRQCVPDVYGRNFLSLVESAKSDAQRRQLLATIATTADGALNGGFEIDHSAAASWSDGQRIALRSAIMPLLNPNERRRGVHEIVADAAHALTHSMACPAIPEVAVLGKRLQLAGRQPGNTEAMWMTRWLIAEGLPTACRSPGRFAKLLKQRLADHPRYAAELAPLLPAVLARAPAAQRLSVLRDVADFTADQQRGAACKRWNLALAVSSARIGRLDEAAKQLSVAIDCRAPKTSNYADNQALLNGYLRFERTQKLPDDLAESVERRLRELIRRAAPATPGQSVCFGLLGLDYRVEAFMAPEIAALAVAMPQPARPALALQTSSRVKERALSSLTVARRLLAEGRPAESAKALVDARQSFELIGHQVGLRRIAFLETAIFDGDLERFVEADPSSSADIDDATTLGAGADQTNPSAPDSIAAAQWAQAFRRGEFDQIRAALDARGSSNSLSPAAKQARVALALVTHPSANAAGLGDHHRRPGAADLAAALPAGDRLCRPPSD